MSLPFKYNIRNLFVRRGTTAMTIVSIAFVVLVYVGVLAMAGGLQTAFADAGDPHHVLVLREGAVAESSSFFPTEKGRLLATLPGVARDADGEPLAAGQLVTVQIMERRDGTENNVTLRGLEPSTFRIYPDVEVVEGRRFDPGKAEVIVGRDAAERFRGLAIGDELELGRSSFRIVGHFEADGGFASEVWAPLNDLQDAFRRNALSSVVLEAASPAEAEALAETVATDQRLQLEARLETDYLAEQASINSVRFVVLGNLLALLLAFGACFAAANTMYAQVSARAREIGTLRSLGFKRRSILLSFLLEAGLLGLLAGGVSVLLALPLNGLSAGMMNSLTFSEMSFQLRTTPGVLLQGVILAVLTALIGGFPAAWAAARRDITTLLREDGAGA